MNTAQNIQKSPATAAGIDLDALEVVNTAQVTFDVDVLFDSEGNPLAGFKCVGKNSPQYQAVTNDIRIANIQRSAARKKSVDATTETGARLVVDTLENNEALTAKAVIVDWYGFNSAGQPAPFDAARVDALLTKYPTWIDAVTSKLEENANFIKV